MSFSPILLVLDTDDDPARAEPLIKEARQQKLPIDGLGVVPHYPIAGASVELIEVAADHEARMKRKLEDRLKKLDLDHHTVAVGRLQDIASRKGLEGGAGLIVKPADRPVGQNAPLFSGMEKKLLRKSPCATLILRDKLFGQSAVGVAIDAPSENDHEHQLLNDSLIRQAVTLAQFVCVKTIHLIHAWQGSDAALFLDPSVGLSPAEVKRSVDEWEVNRREWLDKLTDQARDQYADHDMTFTSQLQMGPAHSAIVEAAESKKLAALVVATINRTGLAGLFIGNTAEGLIDSAPCSVLVVKPEGAQGLLTSLLTR